jgi:cytochrome c oxidase cbb3-type subunit 3
MFRRLFSAGLLVLLPSLVLGAPDGAALYSEHCSACHDDQGQGGIGLPLHVEMLGQASDAYLAETIRVGRPGRVMPAFDDLQVQEIDAIVSFLRSWSDAPAAVYTDAQAIGDAARGAQLFDRFCAECHGEQAAGGSGTGVTLSRERSFFVMPPALANPGFLASAPDAMILRIISEGRTWAGMPPFEEVLSEQDRQDLVVYLRQLGARPEPDNEPVSSVLAYTMESPNDFETTLEDLRNSLSGNNFRIFPERFIEQGLIDEFSHNTRQVQVRFCNFRELYNMLNLEPRLGVILPCAITVLEQEDGTVLLIAPNMRAQARLFNNDQLERLAGVMEGIILEVMEEATF